MSATTTMRRNGAWIVELITPIKDRTREITSVEINPPDFDTVIRWGRGEIPSTLALLAELSNLPEVLLRSLVYPDVDRIMTALVFVVPQIIKEDLENAAKPLAVPREDEGPVNEAVDPIDPRYPKVPGPIQRWPGPASVDEEEGDGSGISADIPNVATG